MRYVTFLTTDLVFLPGYGNPIQFKEMVRLTKFRIVMDFFTKRGISSPMHAINYHREWLDELDEMNVKKILSIKLANIIPKYVDYDIEVFIDVFEGFEFTIDLRSNLYPSLTHLREFIKRDTNHSCFFRTRLDEKGLKTLADANDTPNMKV
ncbi:unnamed protein product [Ambrosiozyma monospora]|uniref:Unnamed protein product n=1 Tax=Ambrosiozyma monospora TaxID=43982 RepID=A0ACB5T4L7_AMBMO|nr:unnamed protein product [Ambrosiozyma monospora]